MGDVLVVVQLLDPGFIFRLAHFLRLRNLERVTPFPVFLLELDDCLERILLPLGGGFAIRKGVDNVDIERFSFAFLAEIECDIRDG